MRPGAIIYLLRTMIDIACIDGPKTKTFFFRLLSHLLVVLQAASSRLPEDEQVRSLGSGVSIELSAYRASHGASAFPTSHHLVIFHVPLVQ